MIRSRVISAFVLLSFLGGCGATSAPSKSTAPDADAPAALQFSAPSVGGGIIDFTQFAGKTVVLWFWAPT
jgi:hypothetical protein